MLISSEDFKNNLNYARGKETANVMTRKMLVGGDSGYRHALEALFTLKWRHP